MLPALVLLTAISQVVGGNAIRVIQARSKDTYVSVLSNYVVAAVLAGVYWLLRGADVGGWPNAVAAGVFTGFFYTAALLTIIRSMGQRGMAVTLALSGLSMLVPVFVAVAFGDRPTWWQGAGIVVALAAMPFLSLATASGEAIRERPSVLWMILLFCVQGSAMSGNLLADKFVAPASMPIYLVTVFGAGLILSIGVWRVLGRKGERKDLVRGGLLGLPNVLSTLIIVTSLAYVVTASTYFAAVGMVGLALTTLIAVVFWRERMHAWGWVGIAMAFVATPLLVLK